MTSDVEAKLVDPNFLVCNVYSSGISAFCCLEWEIFTYVTGETFM
jgi:hypothetical protein